MELGIFDESLHESAEFTFQFGAVSFVPATLNLGLASGIFSGSYAGCSFELYDGGGLISTGTIANILGCQGRWFAGDDGGASDAIDEFVDLSGLVAGEIGRIVLRPIFNPPVNGRVSLSTPSLGFGFGVNATIHSTEVNDLPEPSLAALLAGALLALALRRRGAG
jgi:hypothetical protein